MVTGTEAMCGLSKHELPLAKDGLATATAECPICPQYTNPECPCGSVPLVISQLPGARSFTLHCFHHARGRFLFLAEKTFTLNTDLPSLHIILLPKVFLPPVDLQNALLTIMIFHVALFLLKEFSSEQN